MTLYIPYIWSAFWNKTSIAEGEGDSEIKNVRDTHQKILIIKPQKETNLAVARALSDPYKISLVTKKKTE